METQQIIDNFNRIWRYELFSSGGQPVQLKQLVLALLVIIIGGIASKILTRAFRKRIVKFRHVTVAMAYTLQRMLFYVLFFIVTLVSLSIAGIPITIFTVMGGALAIGIGFGAQNLFNNLISSFIIMFEQPIRVGDIIVMDGMEGRIEEIGNRRVRIRRSDGVDLLVPNSMFLEQVVVNWTFSDKLVRGSVKVGIAYGSDTGAARDILIDCAGKHERINKSPGPAVLFEDFGDSALVFDLLFWTRVMTPMDMRTVESDLRYAIDAAFRAKGITIAFPQRDVHFDAGKPVAVQVVKGEGYG